MWGVIIAPDRSPLSPLHDIAGLPLLARQLLWLHSLGCERIAVEVGAGVEGRAVLEWLHGGDALGLDVVPVLAPSSLGSVKVARRAGVPAGVPFLVIPNDVLGDADPSTLFGDDRAPALVARPAAHPALAGLSAGALEVRRASGRAASGTCLGWSVRVRSRADAFGLSCAIVDGSLGEHPSGPFMVPGTRREDGVVLGRGARIEAGAHVVALVVLGAGVTVRRGARVGPYAFIGAGAVIERGAHAAWGRVSRRVIVGEGLDVRGMEVESGGLCPLSAGATRDIVLDDPLLVGTTDAPSSLAARAVAVLLFAAAWPLALISPARWRSLRHLLAEMLRGERALLGVPSLDWEPLVSRGLREAASRAPRGLIDIERMIVPFEADDHTRLRARAWYSSAKSLRTDTALVVRRLSAWGRRRHAMTS